MSARNGDKARFHRRRKEKIHRRFHALQLRHETSANDASHEHSNGVLESVARTIGETLGTIAAKAHLGDSTKED